MVKYNRRMDAEDWTYKGEMGSWTMIAHSPLCAWVFSTACTGASGPFAGSPGKGEGKRLHRGGAHL